MRKVILKSEFRPGFFYQMLIVVLGISGAAVYFFLAPGFKKFNPYISIFILIFGLLILYFLFLRYLIKIEIDSNGILFKHWMKNQSAYILFNQIARINLEAFQIENLNGPLTEAIPEIIIESENGKIYVISSAIYSNYLPLALKIIEGYNQSYEQRLDEIARKIIQHYIQKKQIDGRQSESKS